MASCVFFPLEVSAFDTRWDSAEAIRWALRAGAGFDGWKIRGSVAGSGSVVAVRRTAPAPFAFS
jgi:hypothetical protein